MNFFSNFKNLITRADTGTGTVPFIIGGDWNATVCTLNSPDNIDILNMPLPPSNIRSQKIHEIMQEGKLTDPFRMLYPDKRDFTYIPRSGRRNRSRIDFFLVSDSSLLNVTDASISHALQSNLFDHKTIFLALGKAETNSTGIIHNSTINHARFLDIVRTGTVDSYLNHADPDTVNLETHKINLGRTLQLIRNYNDIIFALETEGRTIARIEELDRINADLTLAINTLPRLDNLDGIRLTTDPDIFFEVLCMNIKNNLLSFQGWLKKTEKINLNN
jgi:hypothetical protein